MSSGAGPLNFIASAMYAGTSSNVGVLCDTLAWMLMQARGALIVSANLATLAGTLPGCLAHYLHFYTTKASISSSSYQLKSSPPVVPLAHPIM